MIARKGDYLYGKCLYLKFYWQRTMAGVILIIFRNVMLGLVRLQGRIEWDVLG